MPNVYTTPASFAPIINASIIYVWVAIPHRMKIIGTAIALHKTGNIADTNSLRCMFFIALETKYVRRAATSVAKDPMKIS